ncbi:MAG: crotonase/enoyl-CoA hydratase family protein [Pseudomonadota bacterium]|nr:crotonase/enoyl-CoA hydratase family protein [Gammaproteobacteria bacterium]MEC8465813.1 crotonase/enoyl-CoA hydratase family protein [Pseudomonadota bacterium]|tara:strand:- start:748 stop:1611 length:864 start_codon:yes stop_codon:yes gene_type:complete
MTNKYESFNLEIEDNIANIILSRPEQLNSMSRKFWVELPEILEEVNRNSEIRVLIISSTGKHFCAGMDLSAFDNGVANIPKEKRPDNARIGEALYRSARELQEYISKLEKIRVPVIAAIHGGCIGGAVDLVTACDIRLATTDAFFCIQEINIGMAADVGTLQRLPRIIPDSKMRELAYTGRRMLADEAKESGLVSDVYNSQEEMVNAAKEMANEIAKKSPIAIYGLKALMNYSRDHTISDSLDFNALWSGAMLSQRDMEEAIKAFVEKREATFGKMADVKNFDEAGN